MHHRATNTLIGILEAFAKSMLLYDFEILSHLLSLLWRERRESFFSVLLTPLGKLFGFS
jgi:hypothetical protein